VKKAKAFKCKRRLRSIEGSRKPPLAKDLDRFRQWEILASTVVNADMMNTSQREHCEALWAVFGTRAGRS
jgi:hypothetical protein